MSYLEYCENEVATQRTALKEKDARIAKLETLVAERDAMLGKRPCQNSRCNELNAARALLREVVDMVSSEEYNDTIRKADAYLDAFDTLEGKC